MTDLDYETAAGTSSINLEHADLARALLSAGTWTAKQAFRDAGYNTEQAELLDRYRSLDSEEQLSVYMYLMYELRKDLPDETLPEGAFYAPSHSSLLHLVLTLQFIRYDQLQDEQDEPSSPVSKPSLKDRLLRRVSTTGEGNSQ